VSELVEFLRARFDEDEQMARAAGGDTWRVRGDHEMARCVVEGTEMIIYDEGGHNEHDAAHIARVLRDVEAKRQILALHPVGLQPAKDGDIDDRSTWKPCCESCQVGVVDDGDWPCETLRLLSLPYIDHPEYCDEWRADLTKP
jgi:hypothetical protein